MFIVVSTSNGNIPIVNYPLESGPWNDNFMLTQYLCYVWCLFVSYAILLLNSVFGLVVTLKVGQYPTRMRLATFLWVFISAICRLVAYLLLFNMLTLPSINEFYSYICE
jgi:hypothetical protein